MTSPGVIAATDSRCERRWPGSGYLPGGGGCGGDEEEMDDLCNAELPRRRRPEARAVASPSRRRARSPKRRGVRWTLCTWSRKRCDAAAGGDNDDVGLVHLRKCVLMF